MLTWVGSGDPKTRGSTSLNGGSLVFRKGSKRRTKGSRDAVAAAPWGQAQWPERASSKKYLMEMSSNTTWMGSGEDPAPDNSSMYKIPPQENQCLECKPARKTKSTDA